MNLKQAEKLWQEKSLQNLRNNMVGSQYVIEKRPYRNRFSYCVSHYVVGSKVSEYWPQYTTDFKATGGAYS